MAACVGCDDIKRKRKENEQTERDASNRSGFEIFDENVSRIENSRKLLK